MTSTMSQYEVEISPSSRVVLFQGNLKKAPQLSKRGRKKWNERFCVLRANKSLECFKTKKAMESSKNPRKMIDLRECINLEVGLEYKDQQHIFSLGTFKRTFFFGAPSDALMLQWVDCIEKVKNANDKECIKFLDIGLRKTPTSSISKMKTSQSLSKIAALSSSIPNISSIGLQPTINEHHLLKKKDFNKVLRNEKRSPSLPPSSSNEANDTLKSISSLSSVQTSPKRAQRFRSEQKESSDEDTLTRRHHYVNVSPKPPVNKKDPKPVSPAKENPRTNGTRHWSPEEPLQLRSSMPPEVGQRVPPPRFPARMRKGSAGSEETNPFSVLLQKEQVQTIQENLSAPKDSTPAESPTGGGKNLSLGMKRSFRYRHITLKKEKPLLMDVEEEPSTDEEETEDEDKQPAGVRRLYGKKEFARSSPNLTELGVNPNRSNKCAVGQTQLATSSYGVTPLTNYSKVTVVGVKVQSCSISPNHTGGTKVKTGKQDSTNNRRDNGHHRSSGTKGTLICSSEKKSRTSVENSESDSFVLPDRHPSDTFMSCDNISISSLDDIVVDPPEMFDDPVSVSISQSKTEKNEQEDSYSNLPGEDIVNRNSTESNDTGYNSSPSYNQSKNAADKNWNTTVLAEADKNVLTEKSYVCVPVVFYSKNIWKPKGRGKGLLGIQVCLVEQKSSVVNELMSLKELEGFKVLECEQEHGLSAAVKTSPGDTKIVETSLEDLEFGFSVVKSTQKDLFDRRVREFSFEVRNLFSSNRKPFSCEVHIKHANEVIVLPIEAID